MILVSIVAPSTYIGAIRFLGELTLPLIYQFVMDPSGRKYVWARLVTG
jgi:hypothetical protein